VEAMACGTPVLAFNKGSVPEVIDEGITGFVVSNLNDMEAALNKVSVIDRTMCRQKAMDRFDVPVIARHYLSLFN
jgi:glycosyltransferase involved in cell wall biosynthesis